MIEVNALLPEDLGDLLVLGPLAIDRVVATVVFMGCSGHRELRVGNNLEFFTSLVNNLLEVNSYSTPFNIGMRTGVVNQDRQLFGSKRQNSYQDIRCLLICLPDLGSFVTKYKQHGINDI